MRSGRAVASVGYSRGRDIAFLVATSILTSCSPHLLFLMSRHHFSCRDIASRLLQSSTLGHDVATSFLMSRLQLPCRDINLFNFCSFFSCFCLASCHELHQLPFNLHDVVTSELDFMDLQAASLTQQSDFNSALFLTAFLSTYCCIFLLSFSFPVNDTWVSFFIFLHHNYSFLTEN